VDIDRRPLLLLGCRHRAGARGGVPLPLLGPWLRAGLGLGAGIALVVAAERWIAAKYRVTGNALDAAGIGILLATVYAMYARWALIPLVVAFIGMLLVTLLVMAVIYRPLVIECVDPVFLRTVSRAGAPAHLAFLALVVINLVNGFHALGTLLGVGLMILPAGIARFWSRDITGMICIAVVAAMLSGYAGLVLSFQTKIPSGPAIILVAAVLYVASLLFGPVSGLVRQMFPGRHLEA
jgi:ABC-type Mn2+/Zn2+ transport system permease subunit